MADGRHWPDPQCGNGGAFADGIHCWTARAAFYECISGTTQDGPIGSDICDGDVGGQHATTRFGFYWYLPGGSGGNQTSQAFGPWDLRKSRSAQFGAGGCDTSPYALGSWQHPPCGRGPAGLVNDRWYLIEMFVQMNTPGQADGIARGWIDGVLVYEKTNVIYWDVGHDNLHVRTIWLNVYFGGVNVGPGEDTYIVLDQLVSAIGRQIGVWRSPTTGDRIPPSPPANLRVL